MAGLDDREHVHAETRAQWREWLVANHGTSTGVWLVSWRSSSGRPSVGYEESVEEALCVGWVDSKGGKIDDAGSKLWFAPRNPRSAWARTNKTRVARLEAAGLMLPAGLRAIELAKANGAWTMLDDVEDLVVPPDLAAAFDAHRGAREHWEAFPRSARRGILEWIVQAHRADPCQADPRDGREGGPGRARQPVAPQDVTCRRGTGAAAAPDTAPARTPRQPGHRASPTGHRLTPPGVDVTACRPLRVGAEATTYLEALP